MHFRPTNSPGREYDARVFSIGSSFEGAAKTIAVHCQVKGEKKGLLDGQPITGLLSLAAQTQPTVPNTALVHHEGKFYLFALQSTGEETVHGKRERVYTFGREEVIPGAKEMGYTAITPVGGHLERDSIAVRGAFSINAKMSNRGEGHQH